MCIGCVSFWLDQVDLLYTSCGVTEMSGMAHALAKAGAVEERDGSFRAHVQYRGEDGRNANLYGPRRVARTEAKGDLKAMRAAAGVFPDDRIKAFQSMHAEARRLQISAQYAREIEAVTLRRTLSDSDYEEAEEECLQMVDDPDEWWRDLQDGKTPTEVVVEEKPRQINSPAEATEALLKQFRPIRESVAELKRLLEHKADPNVPVPAGLISPLAHVVTFAPVNTVAPMRDLLLQHGATETDEDKCQWRNRQASDRSEPARLRDFYEDDRHLTPWGLDMRMQDE